MRNIAWWTSQYGLFALAGAEFFALSDRGWVPWLWGLTLLVLIRLRFKNRELRSILQAQLTKSTDSIPEPDEAESEQQAMQQAARGIAQIAEGNGIVAEAATGQKKSLLDAGWSEEAAERMGVSFYEHTLEIIRVSMVARHYEES